MTRGWKKTPCFFLQAMEELIAPWGQSSLLFWKKTSECLLYCTNVEQVFIFYERWEVS